ncbi:J domain-containing protein [Synechococcus sp. PCC 6312]|uniref:J domain-containing protein n=1 Tax=Synechococcus sp. (strain ATCC 27167 / PCC 6312) TaxID=195253 RepID=UPI00029EF249|nr:J domain-containing protein [Synechococcus sp. PCC 6312]AFY59402.1 DnaJ-class molecular chaperone with C-terminal Zn finger domain [Synechococcus sp. PCC 6312]
MNDYYKLLGLSPRASKAEIKAAFLQLCKEYHPDKLPPGTPKKARQLVEEHFKKINEAYQVLSEQEAPPTFSQPTNPAWQTQNEPTPEPPPYYRDIFSPQKMNRVSERLEQDCQEIELTYQRRLNEIHQTISRRMGALGIQPRDLTAMTRQGKASIVIFYSLLSLVSLAVVQGMLIVIRQAWINGFPILWILLALLFLLALVGILAFGFMAIKSCLIPVVSQAIFNQSQRINQELKHATAKANQSRTEAKQLWQQQLRQQIDFYKTIPIYKLTADYVATLDAEHQFFLLQALRERSDFGQLDHSLREVAQITISMGIMNMLFGATTVVKS